MNKADMSEQDFQKLLQIALNYLKIRQTLAENDISQIQLEARTLEREEKLAQLDTQILTIRKDYFHYLSFVPDKIQIDIQDYD